jgi:hypothetical protein
LQHIISRIGFIFATGLAGLILATSPANAITIEQCTQGGGIVVRCAEQPVTREDKVTCPAPGKATKLWCFGGFYGHPEPLEILEFDGHSRYQ